MDDRERRSNRSINYGKKKGFDVESGRVKPEREVNCRKNSASAEVYQTAQTSKPIRPPSNLPAERRRADRHRARAAAQTCTQGLGSGQRLRPCRKKVLWKI